MVAVGGVTAMDVTVTGGGGGCGTVMVALPLTPVTVAVILVEPEARAVARPAALMVATAGVEDTQAALGVTSAVEPSL
jgi:hypothetical protein